MDNYREITNKGFWSQSLQKAETLLFLLIYHKNEQTTILSNNVSRSWWLSPNTTPFWNGHITHITIHIMASNMDLLDDLKRTSTTKPKRSIRLSLSYGTRCSHLNIFFHTIDETSQDHMMWSNSFGLFEQSG